MVTLQFASSLVKRHLCCFKFLKNFYLFILSVFGLYCCAWAFSSCSKRGLLFTVVHELLIEMVSLVAEHRL